MKTLLIMRHAKSSWNNSRLSDHERPLNNRGQQDAPKMGRLLKDQDLVPDVIITSTAERALTTAELTALACDFEGEMFTTRRFYHADPETYLAVLREVDDQFNQVMIVGHNPGMEMLVDELTDAGERLTTANIAQVQLPIESWSQLDDGIQGELINLWRPKELNE